MIFFAIVACCPESPMQYLPRVKHIDGFPELEAGIGPEFCARSFLNRSSSRRRVNTTALSRTTQTLAGACGTVSLNSISKKNVL